MPEPQKPVDKLLVLKIILFVASVLAIFGCMGLIQCGNNFSSK